MAFSRMIWAGSTPPPPVPTITSWIHWWTLANGEVINFNNTVKSEWTIIMPKMNDKIAYYAVVKATHNGQECYTSLFMSPDADAVVYSVSDSDAWSYDTYTYKGTIRDSNNIRWYWAGFDWFGSTSTYEPFDNIYSEDLVMSNTVYTSGATAAQDMLDLIYAVPFHEDYQSDYYTLNQTSVSKTIRKALGLSLVFNIDKYAYGNVRYVSDNALTIIDNVVEKVGSNTDIYISLMWSNFERSYLYFYYGTISSPRVSVSAPARSSYNFDYYSIGLLTLPHAYNIELNYGTPTITESEGTYSHGNVIGALVRNISYPGYISVEMNNLGIDL